MSITVTLTVGNNPPVTCDPGTHHKHANSSGDIKWVRAKGSDFTFCALEIAGECFSDLRITDTSITIHDDNAGNGNIGDYPYTLIVRSGDGQNFYSTAYNPGTVAGNDPTIHNN